MGLFNRFAEMLNSSSGYAPGGSVFRNWVQQLASYFNADEHWDEDGDLAAALSVCVKSVVYSVCLVLRGDTLLIRVPSNAAFPPGRLPQDVASFLEERSKRLPYFDWTTASNARQSYFAAQAYGSMNRLDVGTVKDVIEKMLPEVVALDITLQNEGYVR